MIVGPSEQRKILGVYTDEDNFKLVNSTNTKGYPVRVEVFLKGRELNKTLAY